MHSSGADCYLVSGDSDDVIGRQSAHEAQENGQPMAAARLQTEQTEAERVDGDRLAALGGEI